MSNWTYVAIAYTAVWGSLAVYGITLARRVAQAREIKRRLQEHVTEQEGIACDVPPAP